MYDSIEYVLKAIGEALGRFQTYLSPSLPISREMYGTFVSIMVVTLDLLGLVTKYCKSSVLARGKRWKEVMGLRASE